MNTPQNRTAPLVPVLLLNVLLLTMTGCSDDSNPMGPATPAHATSVQDGSLELTVATDKASYAFAAPVTVTVTLTNTGNAPVALDFSRGRPARYPNLNINIDDSDSAVHHAAGDGTLDAATLQAGDSYRYSFVWDQTSRFTRQPVARGVFEISAFANFDDRDQIKADGLFVELK